MKKFLHKKWVRLLLIVVLLFLSSQFIRPRMENPPVTADIMAPDPIKQLLRTACYDCHSNETKLAWFDKITPANRLVTQHIQDGRKALNFSEWDKLTKDQQKVALFESLNQAQFGIMPLPSYTFLHPAAKLSGAQLNTLQAYLRTLITRPMYDTAKTNAGNRQYAQWIQGASASKDIGPAPNGITFMSGYKDWIAISSSERFDNGTMRIIMGDPIAVNAIKTGHTNPWPDGSTFAKVIWYQVVDPSGNIQAGEFKQVDFMIKDKHKYASTDGWGFARWAMGTQLVTYGKNALFATECANCHKAMKENDFVFTTPLNLTGQGELEDKVITSSINKKEGTMSTLYGNETAMNFIRTHTGNAYPAGSALTLVTWAQEKNSHWFGGNIPGTLQSIEKVRFSVADGSRASPVYEKYVGDVLQKTATNDLQVVNERLAIILGQRASVMP